MQNCRLRPSPPDFAAQQDLAAVLEGCHGASFSARTCCHRTAAAPCPACAASRPNGPCCRGAGRTRSSFRLGSAQQFPQRSLLGCQHMRPGSAPACRPARRLRVALGEACDRGRSGSWRNPAADRDAAPPAALPAVAAHGRERSIPHSHAASAASGTARMVAAWRRGRRSAASARCWHHHPAHQPRSRS